MLERKVTNCLVAWKKSENKKALLVTGARQIGKTHTIREFAKSNYKTYLEINFIDTPSAMAIFDGNLDADTIITALTAFSATALEKGQSLIFLMRFRNAREQDCDKISR
ncbi:MAG: AAA family ATPase [Treponema sp.]|nr:AAA family ATPase [Treponema sp.]